MIALLRQLDAFRAVARTTRICAHPGRENILVGGESYATSGVSDLNVKPKGRGGDGVFLFEDNLQQNNSTVWVQNYKVDLPTKKWTKSIVFRQNRR